MAYTVKERQQMYRDRLYEAGLKPIQLWVKRNRCRNEKLDIDTFVKKFEKITSGYNEVEKSDLLNLLLGIIKGKKEQFKAMNAK